MPVKGIDRLWTYGSFAPLALFVSLLSTQAAGITAKTDELLRSQGFLQQIVLLDSEGKQLVETDANLGVNYRAKFGRSLGEGKEGQIFEIKVRVNSLSANTELEKLALVVKRLNNANPLATKLLGLSETQFLKATWDVVHEFGPSYYGVDVDKGLILMQKVSLLDISDESLHNDASFKTILSDLLYALSRLHAHGYTHNDIKADNVGFDGERWKFIDFGTAQKAELAAIGKPSLAYKGQMARFAKSAFGKRFPAELNQKNDIRSLGFLALELRHHRSLLDQLEEQGFLKARAAAALRGVREGNLTKSQRIREGSFLMQELAAKMRLSSSPLKKAIKRKAMSLAASGDPVDRLIARLIEGKVTAREAFEEVSNP